MDVLEQEQQQVEMTDEQLIDAATQTPDGQAQTAESVETPETQQAASDTEAQLAAEALEATEEQPKQQGIPEAVVAELRADRRANRQLIETLQAQLAERNKPVEQPPEPSPLEKWVQDNPDEAEISGPPAAVLVAENNWQKQQAQITAQNQQAKERQERGNASYANAKAKLSDFDDIVEMGSRHLSNGDKLDIATAEDPAMLLYKRCIRATLEAGGPEANLLRQSLKAKAATSQSVSRTPTKTNTQQQTKGMETQTSAAEPTTTMSPQMAHIYNIMGM
jgi:hypothetical protein